MLAPFQRAKKVDEATSSKDEQTPIYLFEELCGYARSTPEDANLVAESLTRKLQARSPITIAKSLKGMKYLCQKGCHDFKRCMQRRATAVRPLQQYQGPMDQLKGDALNAKVRTAAKEAIEAIFEANSAPTMPSSQGRIQGFGSSMTGGNESGRTNPGMPSGQKMVGFGSEQLRAGVPPPVVNSYGNAMQSNRAPTASVKSSYLLSDSERKVDSQAPSGNSHSIGGGGQSVIGTETELVDNICEPGGMRIQPARDDLNQFLVTVGSLNGPKVAEALRGKIEGSSWQEAFRALCALEHVIQHGSSVSCGEIAVNFQVDSSPITRASQSTHSTVKNRANAIMKLLGGDEDSNGNQNGVVPNGSAAKPSTTTPDFTADLLGGIDEPAKAPEQEADLTDMLGFDDQISVPAAAPNQTDALSGGFSIDQPTAAPQQAPAESGLDDMFSGLSMNGPPPPTESQNLTPSASPPAHTMSAMDALLAPSPPSDPFLPTSMGDIMSAPNQSTNGNEQPAAAGLNPGNVVSNPSPFTMPASSVLMTNPGPMAGSTGMNNQAAVPMAQNPMMFPQQGGAFPPQGMMAPGMVNPAMMMNGMMPQQQQMGFHQMMPQQMVGQQQMMGQAQQMMMNQQQMMGQPQQMMGQQQMMSQQGMMPQPPQQGGMMPGASPWGQQTAMPTGMGDLHGISPGSGAVPLAAFVGPANTQRRSSSGKVHPAFSFIGDELKTTMKAKK
ncbi:hypothetical protein BSKO_09912 [Bryopsis sp. KO-2023]|nr:hypothetical protein BSKO_09912 [Bryopsis sp. KO-2023]